MLIINLSVSIKIFILDLLQMLMNEAAVQSSNNNLN